MFEFFKKKEMNVSAAKSFWDWYVENDRLIIDKLLQSRDYDLLLLVDIIDNHLSPVFPYFKNIQFELGGYVDGKYEFRFFYCGNKFLERDSERLKDMMPLELSNHIAFIIEK